MHCRAGKTPEDLEVLKHDWMLMFREYENDAVSAATETWVLIQTWFPSTAEFAEVVEEEHVLLKKRRADNARPALPAVNPAVERTMEEYAAIGKRNIAALRERFGLGAGAKVLGVLRRLDGNVEQTRGHDHHRGAEHCPICSTKAPPPMFDDSDALSTCPGCDGSHFVTVDRSRDEVRPCQQCNGYAYSLWLGGHYEPGHRCDECAPARRRREAS